MNYHYIDYLIKERQRDEIEAYERHRLLQSAGYSQKGLSHWVGTLFGRTVQRLKELRFIPPLHAGVSTLDSIVQIKGVRR